ncbi:hypothetical protein NDQ71_14400 [Pseudoalteromonas sp. KG3]|jgi:hypothetical protein|uniref:Uncharacterized protein n=1 Tax=Pseudoalteromonas prydzensis TaxID=182141 RepID=A0ABR9FIT8_9GAMM|nr:MULTISPECIES: hypothetical protein [Pseudoalteromonas]MBE0456732.1 hypothetical protein [Pseudoalteromonas prydzensis]WKD22817.1 hypothetical protein NDQ71_14400 [Pseudoalteromonas sp. KG3]
MATTISKTSNQRKTKFTPNMDNFKVSLSYEGLSLKKSSEGKTIAELKRKYAR